MDTFFSGNKKKSLEKAIHFVCEESNLKKESVYSNSRGGELSKVRFVLWFILYTECYFSTPEIAKEFGKQSSTIHHGIKFVKSSGIEKDVVSKFRRFVKSGTIITH